MGNNTKLLVNYLIEATVAFAIYSFLGLEIFLVVALFRILWEIYRQADFLRKMIRVMSLGHDAKLLVIMKKLKIDEEEKTREIDKEMARMKQLIGEDKWKQLEKEFAEVMG